MVRRNMTGWDLAFPTFLASLENKV